MATTRHTEGDITHEAPWISVSPAGLWEVQRRWTGERKQGGDTPLMGSVCKIRVCLKTFTETDSQPQSLNETEPVVSDDSDMQITQHPRSQDSVLQVPLDRWVLLRMGAGQCDIVESCLERMRAGESCEITVKAHLEDSKSTTSSDSNRTQAKKTDGECEQLNCFSLHLHSFTPGQESWQMSPAEKWSWVQSHRQRGSQRFGKGDIWGAAQSYCCAVKLVITLKGHTIENERDRKVLNEGEDQDTSTQDEKEAQMGIQSSHIPTEEEYRTMKAELHSNLSLCQLRLNQPAKARASSTKATALDSFSIKAWYRLGQACVQMGDFGEARHAFLKVLELQPDSASARTALRQVNAKAKEVDSKLGQRLSKMFG